MNPRAGLLVEVGQGRQEAETGKRQAADGDHGAQDVGPAKDERGRIHKEVLRGRKCPEMVPDPARVPKSPHRCIG